VESAVDTVNGGNTQTSGLSSGGTFILQAEILHTAQGDIIFLIE
jgi:hypothetical protein